MYEASGVIQNLNPGTWNLELATCNLELVTCNLELVTCNLQPGTCNLSPRNSCNRLSPFFSSYYRSFNHVKIFRYEKNDAADTGCYVIRNALCTGYEL